MVAGTEFDPRECLEKTKPLTKAPTEAYWVHPINLSKEIPETAAHPDDWIKVSKVEE